MKFFQPLFALLMIVAVPFSCKKESTDTSAIDLKNTVWTAHLMYGGLSNYLVSMEFRSGGQLSWNDVMGEQLGSWALENGTVHVKLGANVGFSAQVSAGNSMGGFTYLSGNTWAVTSCEKNNANDDSLDNTTWTAPNLVLKFKPGNLVDVQLAVAVNYTDIPYVTNARSIHFSNMLFNWFFIKGSTSSMQGVNKWNGDPVYYQLEIVRQ